MEIPRFFSMVEVEINSLCNRRCAYCPVSITPPKNVPRFISRQILDRLYDELVRLRFNGRISYHFYNEPLLHPELTNIVSETTLRLPNARQVLYTNGELLGDDRYKELVSAGIALFVITLHSGKPVPQRPSQIVLSPDDLDLTNRGGTLGAIGEPLTDPCFAPSTMLIVTVTGDILLCYEDYYRIEVIGSLLNAPIDEIWMSPDFIEKRLRLAAGDRSVSDICRKCNNRAHLTPAMFDWVP